MIREKVSIPLKDFSDFINEGQKGWEYIIDELDSTDMDKHIQYIESVRRRSDGKYFKFVYAKTPYHKLDNRALNNNDPMIGSEVFPREVITIIYE